jgi:hypothetical protein
MPLIKDAEYFMNFKQQIRDHMKNENFPKEELEKLKNDYRKQRKVWKLKEKKVKDVEEMVTKRLAAFGCQVVFV